MNPLFDWIATDKEKSELNADTPSVASSDTSTKPLTLEQVRLLINEGTYGYITPDILEAHCIKPDGFI